MGKACTRQTLITGFTFSSCLRNAEVTGLLTFSQLHDGLHFAPNMENCSTETSVYIQRDFRHYIAEDKYHEELTKQLWVRQCNNSSFPFPMLLPHVSVIRPSSSSIQ
jgi:hypothetical protein